MAAEKAKTSKASSPDQFVGQTDIGDKQKEEKRRKTLTGVVVSSKAKDTLVVAVTRYVKHPKYKKYLKQAKRYQVHNPGNTKELGERVTIYETRPISKTKHFKLVD